MLLAYDGTDFSGWQIQPNAVTVQETIQQAMSTIARQELLLVGAGRTDAGVHASSMVAHFDFERDSSPLPFDAHKLNRLLPPSISIKTIEQVSPDFHARFDAVSRSYHYNVSFEKDPFTRRFSTYLHKKPDLDAMNQAAILLLGKHDFSSFSKLHTDVKTNDCFVTKAIWELTDASHARFTISANRFLRDMVRAIVGTLLRVGYGKMSLETFQEVFHAKDRCAAAASAPAEGLFLVDVSYP